MGATSFGSIVTTEAPGVMTFTSPTTQNTAGVVTYTAQQLLGGLILRDPNGASRNDLFPPAADIVAALQATLGIPPSPGMSFNFSIRNTADAAETINFGTAAGLTLSGTMTLAQNYTRQFSAVVTSAGVTIYSLGAFVH
jgi:hypothetical protein